MALHYSKQFKVSHRLFFEKGVFDGTLDIDSHLHVDPLLLKTCCVPEFHGAYEEFLEYFNKITHLVPFVKVKDDKDRFYKQIVERFTFHEISNTGLGFSKKNTKGRGISGALSIQLADTAMDIISAGYIDAEIFLLMPIFEDNISIDRISDMTIAILIKRIVLYTARIAKELGIKTTSFVQEYADEIINLPIYNERPVLFLPVELLADIPIATSRDDIDRVVHYANRLKKKVAEAIGISWSEYRFYKKPDWKKAIFDSRYVYQEALGFFKGLRALPYDFQTDEKDEYLTARLQDMAIEKPLDLLRFLQNHQPTAVYDITCAIIEQFRRLVEDKYMWKIFHRKQRSPDEPDWQYYLMTVADTYLRASNADIDVTRENNSGPGLLDFKFTRGAHGKTVVEIKRASNENLLHGYVSQLPAYMAAEAAEHGIYLIIKEDDSDEDAIQNVFEYQRKNYSEQGTALPIIVVDARPKLSASRN